MEKKITLLDFWAPWCAPCRAIGPVIDSLEKKFEGRVTVVRVNIDETPELAQQHHVQSIPTLIVTDQRGELKRFIGGKPEAVLELAIEEALK